MRLPRMLIPTLLLTLLSLPSLAQAEEVRVQVTVIHASKTGSEVDPALEPLKRQLSAFAFSSYKLLEVRDVTLAFGEAGKVRLPGGRTLVVEPKTRDADGKLRVRLTIGELVDTTYAIAEGGTLILGGPKYKDGVLILAVTQAASDG